MKNPLFILGAADVEMQAIESLLKNAGLQYAYAAVGGIRCHPGNAYKADSLISSDGTAVCWQDVTHTIECAPIANHECRTPLLQGHLDHHREGDSGYGRLAEDFLEASSIGQLIHLLAKMDKLPDWPVVDADGLAITTAGSIQAWKDGWAVGDGVGERRIPDSLVMVAAADHCLSAAYRGECPGVDPDELMKWRAESRASFQKRPVSDVLADVEKARKKLREAIADKIARTGFGPNKSEYVGSGQISWDNGSGYMETSDCDFLGIYADLRPCNYCGGHGGALGYEDDTGPCHQGPYGAIPELPEASAREGIPFLTTMQDRDGRKKVSIMGAGESLVRKFLVGELVPGLVDMYGDPARGFAGGYEA